MRKPTPRKKIKIIRLFAIVLPIVLLITSLYVVTTPIKTLRVGECPGPTIRLNVKNNGWELINKAEQEEKERVKTKEQYLEKNPGIAMGCVPGKTYQLYRH